MCSEIKQVFYLRDNLVSCFNYTLNVILMLNTKHKGILVDILQNLITNVLFAFQFRGPGFFIK